MFIEKYDSIRSKEGFLLIKSNFYWCWSRLSFWNIDDLIFFLFWLSRFISDSLHHYNILKNHSSASKSIFSDRNLFARQKGEFSEFLCFSRAFMTLSRLLLNYSWLILYLRLTSLIFIKGYLRSMPARAKDTALSKSRQTWYPKVGLSLSSVWWREKRLKKRGLWCDIFWQRVPTLLALHSGGPLGKRCRLPSGGSWRRRLIQEEL